ncbi:MAG: SurA N-terminal domain-containing protein [Candidatus Omnitrophota bacterium]
MVLSILRSKKFSKRVLLALLILIVPAFVLWGAGSLTSGPGAVGKINNKTVTVNDLAESVRGIRAQLIFSHYTDLDTLNRILENRAVINHMAWERLVLLDASKREKIKIKDSDLLLFISQHPLFQRNGMFDRSVYDYILRNNLGMEPRMFEELTKENIQVGAFRQKVLEDISVSEEEIVEAYKVSKDASVLSYILVDKTLFPDQAPVSENEEREYYTANKKDFFTQPSIDIEYTEFPYENAEEKREAEEKSLGLFKELSDGDAELSSLSKEKGLAFKTTGSFTHNDIVPGISFFRSFRDAAFELDAIGAVSYPVFPDSGDKGTAYLLRKIGDDPSRTKTFEEVREEIKAILLDKKLIGLAQQKAKEISAALTSKDITFEEAALQLDRKAEDTEIISSGSYVENLGPARELALWAHSSSVGDISGAMKVKDGFVIARVKRLIPADTKSDAFETAKASLRSDILSRKQLNKMDEWFGSNADKTVLLKDLGKL